MAKRNIRVQEHENTEDFHYDDKQAQIKKRAHEWTCCYADDLNINKKNADSLVNVSESPPNKCYSARISRTAKTTQKQLKLH